MRRNVLGIGLAACWFVVGAAPSRVAASTTPTREAAPMPAEQPAVGWPGVAENWLRDAMLDRLTIPLGMSDRWERWPAWFGGSEFGAIR
jgi:hypothetical protein